MQLGVGGSEAVGHSVAVADTLAIGLGIVTAFAGDLHDRHTDRVPVDRSADECAMSDGMKFPYFQKGMILLSSLGQQGIPGADATSEGVMVRPIGVGIVGCGDIARLRYVPAVARSKDLALHAVFSRTARSAQALAVSQAATPYSDFDAMMADPRIDALIIASPHPTHADYAVRSLGAGKHVLIEKPVATSCTDMKRLKTAADASAAVAMALPLDWTAAASEAARLVEDGAIGMVSSVDCVFCHEGPVHAPWFFDRREAEWGVLADLGVYAVSLLTRLLGPVSAVSGRVETTARRRTMKNGQAIDVTVDDNVTALLTWPNSTLGTVRCNWCTAIAKSDSMFEARLYGSEGIIFLKPMSLTEPLIVYSPNREIRSGRPVHHDGLLSCYEIPVAVQNLDDQILSEFAASIRGTGPRSGRAASVEHQQHVVAVIDAIYRSSASGQSQILHTDPTGAIP